MNSTHDHSHSPPQPDDPGPDNYYQFLGLALNELLIEKGIYSNKELHDMIAYIDSIDVSTHGARIVSKAWSDPEFRETLRKTPNQAIESTGLNAGSSQLKILENTSELHNVVVCTLCSCYPRALLGRPPKWYKDNQYRSRMVYQPRAVLEEFGTHIPNDVEVRVHDSTAELRYLVIPVRPSDTDGLTEQELTSIITRDSMIGVTTL